MFDLSFAELLVIAVVALVVLGPERLPRAARFTGLWVRRARAQWQSVRSEFERELAAEELKRNLDQARSAMRDTDRDIRGAEAAVRREAQQLRDGVATGATLASDPPAPAVPGGTSTPATTGATIATTSTSSATATATATSATDEAGHAEPSVHPSEPTELDGPRR